MIPIDWLIDCFAFKNVFQLSKSRKRSSDWERGWIVETFCLWLYIRKKNMLIEKRNDFYFPFRMNTSRMNLWLRRRSINIASSHTTKPDPENHPIHPAVSTTCIDWLIGWLIDTFIDHPAVSTTCTIWNHEPHSFNCFIYLW